MPSHLYLSDLKSLYVFMMVVNCGGLSAAQIRLHMNLSSVSSHLQALEKRLGARLCSRGRSGFSVTEEGQRVYGLASEFFPSLEIFFSKVKSSNGRLSGTLRIGVSDGEVTNADFMLWNVISEFRKIPRNEVLIEIDSSPPDRTIEQVLSGGYHVGFGHFPVVPSGLTRSPLFMERQVLYVGQLHPKFQLASYMTLDDIENLHFAMRAGPLPRETPDVVARQRAAAVATTAEGRATLILSGQYVGYLPEHFARPWLQRGLMRPVLQDDLSYTVAYHALIKEVAVRSSFLQAFLDLMPSLKPMHLQRPVRSAQLVR